MAFGATVERVSGRVGSSLKHSMGLRSRYLIGLNVRVQAKKIESKAAILMRLALDMMGFNVNRSSEANLGHAGLVFF
jgi:hypothetical protein